MKSLASAMQIVAAAATLGLVAACGQKGPLYLPDRGTVITRQPGASAPGTAPTQGQQTSMPPQSSAPAPSQQTQPGQPPSSTPPQKPDDRKDENDSQPKQ